MMQEVELEIYGRVQGIRLRQRIKSLADQKRIKGFVQNREDGSVFAVLQGQYKDMRVMLNWIQSNPILTKITEIRYKIRAPIEKYEEFTIKKEGNYIQDKIKSISRLAKEVSFYKKQKKVPTHIAIIPDGNRRWASQRGFKASTGHYRSAQYENIESLFLEAKLQGIKYLSLWGFSTENWQRDKNEIKEIFELINKNLEKLREKAHKEKIRMHHIGRKDRLPKDIIENIYKLENETQNYNSFNLLFYLDYGGKDEILRAVNKAINEGAKSINEDLFRQFLDTRNIPDPDFIIRTSGEQRLSGFLPFQSAYAELYFTPVHFPDFDVREFRKAINEFDRRQRRFGA
jgi:undecaprenyl diphosphate synthase